MTFPIPDDTRTISDLSPSQGVLGMAAAWRDGWRGAGAARMGRSSGQTARA